jgi:hypothetical protein
MEVFDGFEMFEIRTAKGFPIFNGGSGDNGVSCPQSVGDGVLLNVDQGTMADIFSKGEYLNVEVFDEGSDLIVLFSILGALQKFQIALERDESCDFFLNALGRL